MSPVLTKERAFLFSTLASPQHPTASLLNYLRSSPVAVFLNN